jgi:hypothetical protein
MMDWKKIWEGVLTSVISVFIGTLLISAAAIVWQKANSVDQRVEDATKGASEQRQYMEEAIKILQEEFVEQKRLNNELMTAINRLTGDKEPVFNPEDVPEHNYIQQKLPEFRFPQSR